MARYKITGNHSVAGKQPGETIDSEELAGAPLEMLITAGHLSPSRQTRAADPTETPSEED